MVVDDNNVVDAVVDDKVLMNVDAADTTDMVGDKGNTFFVDAK
jgi:hypothetical protein